MGRIGTLGWWCLFLLIVMKGLAGVIFRIKASFFYLTKYLNVFCCKDADRILCSGLTGIKLDLNNTQRGNHIYFFILK